MKIEKLKLSICSASDRTPLDLAFVDQTVARVGRSAEAVIPILQAIQEHYRFLPEEALRRVCQISEITPAAIVGVSTFYSQFRHKPVGRHIIRVCHGTACHVRGSELVEDALRQHLKMASGQETDAKGQFTIERVGCLGCCTLAPVMQIDGITYGHRAPDTAKQAIEDFLRLAEEGTKRGNGTRRPRIVEALAEVRIGVGSCCVAGGAMGVKEALEKALWETAAPAVVKPVGCVGMCHQTPLVEVSIQGRAPAMYARVQSEQAAGIIRRHFRPRGVIRKIRATMGRAMDRLLTDELSEPVTRYALDTRDAVVCDFLGPQKRIATEFCGSLDPLDIEEYERHEGFVGLRKVVASCQLPVAREGAERPGDAIIEQVKASGLRGRGGAGFPTGQKWATVRAAAGEEKYIICNGDEGDPGAFMDRMILESYPYRVLEGMIIGAIAVGATRGYLYIRHEYPLAVRRIAEAIRRMEERNLLGESILGSTYRLHLEIKEGAGAFVCGEETALIASIEGGRGMPRLRPPYPAESGLWGKPTCINNVETFAQVPWILRHGAGAFAAIGTRMSKGTKVFALTGKIRRGGLIEVPMGTTVRQVVEEIGGGVNEGRKFKAVQIGGPSGGCVPAELADTPIDYESLAKVGAIMGSGGLVVLDDSDCMVDIARYFLHFTQVESCGKCTFCRIGTRRMRDILDRLCDGDARRDDLTTLEELAQGVKRSSLCGLGQTAPNPVISTLKYFRHEYEEHLKGRCPAGRCKALIRYQVKDSCIGCTKCAQECPSGAIAMRPYEQHEVDHAKCTKCDMCLIVCPVDAVEVR